jgi:hypothetical protein
MSTKLFLTLAGLVGALGLGACAQNPLASESVSCGFSDTMTGATAANSAQCTVPQSAAAQAGPVAPGINVDGLVLP